MLELIFRLASPAERWGGFGTCVQNKTTGETKPSATTIKAQPLGFNTTTASMGHGYTQDQYINSESTKTDPEIHHPQDTCKAESRTCHTNTKC